MKNENTQEVPPRAEGMRCPGWGHSRILLTAEPEMQSAGRKSGQQLGVWGFRTSVSIYFIFLFFLAIYYMRGKEDVCRHRCDWLCRTHLSLRSDQISKTLWEDSLKKQEVADRKRTTFLDVDTHTHKQKTNQKKTEWLGDLAQEWGSSSGVGILLRSRALAQHICAKPWI